MIFRRCIVHNPLYLPMFVKQFNVDQGYYEFQFEGLETELHSHPVIEILIDPEGKMSLSCPDGRHENLFLAIIDSNVPHRIIAPESSLQVVMVEHREVAVKHFLSKKGIALEDGIFTGRKLDPNLLDLHSFSEILLSSKIEEHFDERVLKTLSYLRQHEVAYDNLLDELTDLVHLSKSRLSHLFKEQVGISIKKYLLWCKLRNTIAQHLSEKEDLFASLINSGFYDQPHFSRAFKTMLGVNPTKAYNSRTVQGN